jgi:methylthioribulose-1-phosphate dehydratase
MYSTSKQIVPTTTKDDEDNTDEPNSHKDMLYHIPDKDHFSKIIADLAEIGKSFYSRGWVLGTSGNFSAIISQQPLRLAITSTGVDKGSLVSDDFLEIDDAANVIRGHGYPSKEVLMHLAIIRCTNASVVLHTHSVPSTVLSNVYASKCGITFEGYEMLKGLEGIQSHQQREWLPILENSQEMIDLSQTAATILREHNCVHGFLIRGHGLYTWGSNIQQAKHHVEILEFLMEVLIRSSQYAGNIIHGAA